MKINVQNSNYGYCITFFFIQNYALAWNKHVNSLTDCLCLNKYIFWGSKVDTGTVHIQTLTMDNYHWKLHVSTWTLGLSMILQRSSLCPLMAFTVQHQHIWVTARNSTFKKRNQTKIQSLPIPFSSFYTSQHDCLSYTLKAFYTWLITQYLF